MNRQTFSLWPVLFMIWITHGLTGCSTMTSHADWDTTANFAALKTYSWAPGQQPLTGDPRIDHNVLLDERVRQAVDDVLGSRGYQKNETNPDFWISYQAAIESKISATTMPSYGYATPYANYHGMSHYDYAGWDTGSTMVTQYDEGSIIIDVADAKARKLIWRGTVSDVVNPSRTPAKRQQKIDEAITKVFADFPPQ